MNASKQIVGQMIFISIDSYKNRTFIGRLRLGNANKEIGFDNLMQLLLTIDTFLGEIDDCEDTVRYKLFVNPSARDTGTGEVLSEGTEPSYGALATFKLKVLFRQNASWQGTITWLDNKQERSFRSNLELIMLMDSALTCEERTNYV